MRKDRLTCPVCSSSTQKEFHCASCVNTTVFDADCRQSLHAPQQQKEALAAKLQDLLRLKDAARDQVLARRSQQLKLEALQRRVAATKEKLEQGRQRVQELEQHNRSRRQRLEQAQTQLRNTRSEIIENSFPTIIHYQALTHTHVHSSLLREAETKILALLEIFPISYAATRHGQGPPERLFIRNLQLPETSNALLTSDQSVEEVNAALGYLLQFMELLPRYLGGPLLHEADCQASTSRLWLPQSYWDRQPLQHSAVHTLHSTPPSTNPLSSQLNNISSRVQQSTNTLWRFPSRIYRAPSTTPSGAPSPLERQHSEPVPPPPRPSAPARSPHLEARAAYEILTRSIACLIQDRAHDLKIQLPSAWPPLACMVLICTLLRQESRPDGAPGGDLGGSILLQASRGHTSVVFNNGYILANDDDMFDDDIDGWDVINSPAPPPPSKPDEVEHWTRAMYTDAQDAGSLLPQPAVQQVQEGIRMLLARASGSSSTP